MRKHLKILVITIFFLVLPSISHSDVSREDDGEATKSDKGGSLSIIPMFGYTPETELLGGVMGIYTFHLSGEGRPSNVLLSGTYTQKKQYSVSLAPELYFRGGGYRLQSTGIGLLKSPEAFYGIGNDTADDAEERFTYQATYVRASFQKRTFAQVAIGIQYDFEKSRITETEENSLLAGDEVLGSEGGRASGFGILVNWDSRDNVFFTTDGGFYQISSMIYRDVLGSEHEFSEHRLDLRQYISVIPSHTLAFQVIFSSITGEPPFQKLSLLGGQSMMRGYYQGRYRDKNMIAFQMEYRIVPVWWRLGLVGFLGFGDVSDDVANFKLTDFKHSVGFGVRFPIIPEERINLRADFAVGEDTLKFYLNIGEAF